MKTIRQILVVILMVQCANYVSSNSSNFFFKKAVCEEKKDTVKTNTYEVTATMYYPVSSQCDSDPLLTAGMYKIKPEKASEQKWIAMSRDLLERWKGEFKYGDLVKIEGAGHKDGVYKVVDTMNKRFKNRIDFLETAGTKQYKFTNVKLTKWNTQTPTENLLAAL